jgi:flagellar biosynthesis/type III secretory pathway chaperone
VRKPDADERKGLEMMLRMDRTRLCEMVADYAEHESVNDLADCWSEVLETIHALRWLEEVLKEGR